MKRGRVVALSLCLVASSASSTRAGPGEGADNPVAEIPLSSLSATRERPLFAPSRRPPPAADAPGVDASAPNPSPSPALTLLGTVIGPSDRVAVVGEGAESPVSLHVGESGSGWTLRAVGPRTATFEGFGRTMTLALTPAAPPPSAEPATNEGAEKSSEATVP